MARGRVSATRLLAGLDPEEVLAALEWLRLEDRRTGGAQLHLDAETFGTVVTWIRTAPPVRVGRRRARGAIAADLRRLGRAAYAARDSRKDP